MRRILGLFLVVLLAGCCAPRDYSDPPQVNAANLGRQITVEGWSVNRKNGAQVVGVNFGVWIAGLSEWPPEYYTGGDRGQRVRVTGILAEDEGLPVFIPKKDEDTIQGIPMPEGTDLKSARRRFLLTNATWTLVKG
jgi:hypothetical protein